MNLDSIVSGVLRDIIKEIKTVSYNSGSFPNYGWCFILMGAPGSGKSYFVRHRLLANAKVFDIDDFRERYATYLKRNGREIKDFKTLHTAAAEKLRNKETSFISSQGANKGNIIFDICGRPGKRGEKSLAEEIIRMVKPYGYNVALIWVVANRSVAMQRNVKRSLSGDRKLLPDKPFHQRTNQVNKFVPIFLESQLSSAADKAYVVFSTGENLKPITPEEEGEVVVELQRGGNGSFIIDNNLKQKIERVLGPKETSNGYTPEVYKTNAEVRKYLKQNIKMTDFLKNSEPISEERKIEFEEDYGRPMSEDDKALEIFRREMDAMHERMLYIKPYLENYAEYKCSPENEEEFNQLLRILNRHLDDFSDDVFV